MKQPKIKQPKKLYFQNGNTVGAVFPDQQSALHIPNIKEPTIFSYKPLDWENLVLTTTIPGPKAKAKAKGKAKAKKK